MLARELTICRISLIVIVHLEDADRTNMVRRVPESRSWRHGAPSRPLANPPAGSPTPGRLLRHTGRTRKVIAQGAHERPIA